ncbi:hypothetical protein OXB_3353 [Bacillus sp. OxB-1]|uniref:STM3941 family protein n=1 Tax=Bacillus sp. (strain OxB-1) TaxID=98228 RepID=UPI000581DCBA|nr:STM3941 family protein [Bacillus sp. OxB-1]BAQ11822.1 hypothetical protein OXB_3353 [Bacillus sp. OxB-1]
MNTIEIYPKKGRMFMLSIFSLLFTLLGVLFLWISTEEGSPFWLGIIGVITIAFFGLGGVYYVKELMIRKPAVMITDEGIIDRSSFIGAGLVKWEEIESVEFITMSGQLFLAIFTFDPNLIIDRSSGIKRILNKLNQGLLPSQVNIPAKNLACSPEELLDKIGHQWQLKLDETLGE